MDNKQFEMMLSDAEVRLDRLKALYEQWFQGIERLEPLIPRKNLERQISLLRREKPRNTRLRFRFQVLIQRYTTYLTYWQRVSRQIEEGSYRRDILRVRKQREAARIQREREIREKREQRASENPSLSAPPDKLTTSHPPQEAGYSDAAPGSSPPLQQPNSSSPPGIRSISPFALPSIPSPSISASASSSNYSAASDKSKKKSVQLRIPDHKLPEIAEERDAKASAHVATAKARNPSRSVRQQPRSGGDDLSDQQIRKIYDQYLYARMKNKESTDNIKIEKLAQSMRKIVPQLKKKHRGKSIDFQVVIKNGKVALKPVVR